MIVKTPFMLEPTNDQDQMSDEFCIDEHGTPHVQAVVTGIPSVSLVFEMEMRIFTGDDRAYVRVDDVVAWYERKVRRGVGCRQDREFINSMKAAADIIRREFTEKGEVS